MIKFLISNYERPPPPPFDIFYHMFNTTDHIPSHLTAMREAIKIVQLLSTFHNNNSKLTQY